MNKEYITKFLATEVCKWNISGNYYITWYSSDHHYGKLKMRDFNPLTDIAHAFMVVEALRKGVAGHVSANIGIHIIDDAIYEDVKVVIYAMDIERVFEWGKSIPATISIAAFKALATKAQIKKAELV